VQSPLNFVYGSSGIGSAFSSIRPFDIKHECRKGQPVMTTTNLFALRGTRSNQECCFFRSICPLCMSRQDFDTLNLPARQPPAASGLDQPIHRQVKQAQVGKRRRTGDGRAETEERETEDGGKANARSGASPIERTGSPENTVVSYAPWDFWAAPASDGKKTSHPRTTASSHTAPS